MDNWTVPRLPESAARGTFQTSRRGLALPGQRPKGRRGRRDFGTGSTRRRDAARWRDEIGPASADFHFKPVKPRGRNVGQAGIAGLVPRRSQHLRASEHRSRPRPTKPASEPPGGKDKSSWLAQPLTDPAPARAPGDNGADLQLPARACRTRHRDARRKALFGAHTPVRVGSTARLAPFLFRARESPERPRGMVSFHRR